MEEKAPPKPDATDVSLKEYVDTRIRSVKEKYQQNEASIVRYADTRIDAVNSRVDDGDTNLREHMASQGIALEAALEAARREASFSRDAADKAITAARAAAEKAITEARRTSEDMTKEVGTVLRIRIDEGDQRLREHIMQQYAQIAAALESARREATFSAEAAQKAIDKADTATEKRFESVNEFREQLNDQASRFQSKELAAQQANQTETRLRDLETKWSTYAGQEQAQLRTQDRSQPWMIWAMGAAVTIILALLIFAANFLTGA